MPGQYKVLVEQSSPVYQVPVRISVPLTIMPSSSSATVLSQHTSPREGGSTPPARPPSPPQEPFYLHPGGEVASSSSYSSSTSRSRLTQPYSFLLKNPSPSAAGCECEEEQEEGSCVKPYSSYELNRKAPSSSSSSSSSTRSRRRRDGGGTGFYLHQPLSRKGGGGGGGPSSAASTAAESDYLRTLFNDYAPAIVTTAEAAAGPTTAGMPSNRDEGIADNSSEYPSTIF